MKVRADVKVKTRLKEMAQDFAIPLREVADDLMRSILPRIARGIGASGYFSPLGARSVPRGGHGLFWVPPGQPQPAGWVAAPEAGKLAGWRGYKTYRAYCAALGSPPRDFSQTLQFLGSIRARVNGPGRLKIAPYGRHSATPKPGDEKQRGIANTAVGYLASRFEAQPLFMPTRAEVQAAAKVLQTEVGAQLTRLSAEGQAVKRLDTKLSRIQKRLAAQSSARI